MKRIILFLTNLRQAWAILSTAYVIGRSIGLTQRQAVDFAWAILHDIMDKP